MGKAIFPDGGRPPRFDTIDFSDVPATGDILYEGPMNLIIPNNSGEGSVVGPGVVGLADATVDAAAFVVSRCALSSQSFVAGNAPGTKLTVKGRILAHNTTIELSGLEKFGFGFTHGTSASSAAMYRLIDKTSTLRDDLHSVAVVVDDTDSSIQSYNTAIGGGAAYTDSTHNADLSAWREFRAIIETPSTTDNPDDQLVTLMMEDDGGTLRTILSGVSPQNSTSGGPQSLGFILAVNVPCVAQVYCRIETL